MLGPLQGVKNRLAEFSGGIVTDANVAPMHGWRHRWKSLAIDAGIPQRVQDAVLGHAARDVAGTYGEVSVAVMAREVERVPRISASLPYLLSCAGGGVRPVQSDPLGNPR